MYLVNSNISAASQMLTSKPRFVLPVRTSDANYPIRLSHLLLICGKTKLTFLRTQAEGRLLVYQLLPSSKHFPILTPAHILSLLQSLGESSSCVTQINCPLGSMDFPWASMFRCFIAKNPVFLYHVRICVCCGVWVSGWCNCVILGLHCLLLLTTHWFVWLQK